MAILSKEKLKDGKILDSLVERYMKESTWVNLVAVLSCIVDSEFFVPMNVKEDVKEGELGFTPDYLLGTTSKTLYLPIFTNMDVVPEDYKSKFSWVSLNVNECIALVNLQKECVGFILNPYTYKLEIKDKIFGALKLIRDKMQEEQ